MTSGYVARSLAAARAVVSGRGTSTPTLPSLPVAPTFSNVTVTQITPTTARVSSRQRPRVEVGRTPITLPKCCCR